MSPLERRRSELAHRLRALDTALAACPSPPPVRGADASASTAVLGGFTIALLLGAQGFVATAVVYAFLFLR